MIPFLDNKQPLPDAYDIRNLSKNYGKFKALDNVNLTLPEGKIIGLLGKNGAGKSTLMRCMLGFLTHDGEVSLDGRQIHHRDHKVFEQVGFIPDVSGLDDRLTVQQTIDYIKGVNPRWNDGTAQKLLAISSLPLTKKVYKLSKGMKTKLYLLITLSLDVKFLLLDEPTLGLDIAFRKEFFNTILGEFFDETKTLLISTHQVEEVEDLLQEIIFIDEGKIILHEEVESLKTRFRIVTVPTDKKDLVMVHKPKSVSKTLGFVSVILDSSIEIPDAIYARPNLADIFMAIVGGSNESN
ncbi:MAG: multidrug ABC transporter ATP-binding protein [Candidatus Cloacimonetes bacterium HGW-Cloacimonetes-1]|jgi:ABC-2 type transport system ATP-binding protein|nr:MAG: multidrug ABC transporter ATP-binding protein [Candidatus Cloacimonetes bacterium HGW-Cloacimonetes-1]